MQKEAGIESLPTKKVFKNLKRISDKGLKTNDTQTINQEINDLDPSIKKNYSQMKNFSQNMKSLQLGGEEKFRKTNLSSLILKNICTF